MNHWSDEDDGPENPTMQNQCVHCLTAQYVLNVVAISYGQASCTWCGKMSRPMGRREYRDALTERRVQIMRGLGDDR
jgi:hypothetical protein